MILEKSFYYTREIPLFKSFTIHITFRLKFRIFYSNFNIDPRYIEK